MFIPQYPRFHDTAFGPRSSIFDLDSHYDSADYDPRFQRRSPTTAYPQRVAQQNIQRRRTEPLAQQQQQQQHQQHHHQHREQQQQQQPQQQQQQQQYQAAPQKNPSRNSGPAGKMNNLSSRQQPVFRETEPALPRRCSFEAAASPSRRSRLSSEVLLHRLVRVQSLWRGHATRKQRIIPALREITRIRDRARALQQPSRTMTVYQLAGLEEECTRLLFALDSVSARGSSYVRERRKSLVNAIQNFANEKIVPLKEEAIERQNSAARTRNDEQTTAVPAATAPAAESTTPAMDSDTAPQLPPPVADSSSKIAEQNPYTEIQRLREQIDKRDMEIQRLKRAMLHENRLRKQLRTASY